MVEVQGLPLRILDGSLIGHIRLPHMRSLDFGVRRPERRERLENLTPDTTQGRLARLAGAEGLLLRTEVRGS